MELDKTQMLLDALSDAAFLINDRREVVAANEIAGETFGELVKGRDLALSLRHPSVLEAVDRVLTGDRTNQVIFELAATPQRVFEVHVAALSFDPDENAQALCTLRDVTAMRETERIRADFVANVSHELRSPLTSLMGFIETLKGPARADSAAQSRFLEIMDVEARRMARLVDDLLSLSRIEAREHLAPTEIVDARRLLLDVAETIVPRAMERGIEIRMELGSNLAPVSGDHDELVEVIHNLIDNAVKYGRTNTPVNVRITTKTRIPDIGGLGVSIAVTNMGDLISAEHLPRLTERFYRIDKGRSRDAGGTGLGLAIVKHIINRHRGRLTIESTAKAGNTFTVYLPVVEQRTSVTRVMILQSNCHKSATSIL